VILCRPEIREFVNDGFVLMMDLASNILKD